MRTRKRRGEQSSDLHLPAGRFLFYLLSQVPATFLRLRFLRSERKLERALDEPRDFVSMLGKAHLSQICRERSLSFSVSRNNSRSVLGNDRYLIIQRGRWVKVGGSLLVTADLSSRFCL